MHRPWAFWLDMAFKAALVGLLAFGAFSGLDQFEGKAFGWRLVFYPLAAVIVPLGWWLAGRPKPYPYALDILLVSPFLVDVVGNALDLYDSISWWDDLNHFVNWAILTTAFGLFLIRPLNFGGKVWILCSVFPPVIQRAICLHREDVHARWCHHHLKRKL